MPVYSLRLKQTLVSLETPIIMGILNITGNSFYDGGAYLSETAVLKRVEQIVEEGATIVDLGAVSTQPDITYISDNKEFEVIQKYLRLIRSHFPETPVSVDTFRANVAEMAICEGAVMINDISGGIDPEMFNVAGKYQIPYVITHNNRANPLSTKELIPNMLSFFGNSIEILISKGVNDIIVDPGFGFGKTLEQNFYLINQLRSFSVLGFPILAGISRKSMIQKVLETSPAESLTGTIALNIMALYHGASLLRVHNVKQCTETIQIFNLLHSL
jgi:dihydropteroate synthase